MRNRFSQTNIAVEYAFKRGYRVLPDGNVLSPDNHIKKLQRNRIGYLQFSIRINGKNPLVFVHKLCAYQKYGELSLMCDCIRHLDGNSLNNSFENIEIGTISDNRKDIDPNKRKRAARIASHSYIMKWNEEDVCEIKRFYLETKSYRETMDRFGIPSKGSLHYILNKR